MGQKIHPLGFRIGINERWRSRWMAGKKDIAKFIREDFLIRRYIKKNYLSAAVPRVDVERSGDATTIIMHTARPGILLGRKGKKLEEIQAEILTLLKTPNAKLLVTIVEVNRPELDGQLLAENIREQIEKRQPFRRVLKKSVQTSISAGARGVRVRLSGRLGGAELSRVEHLTKGSVPLTTLDADINYGFTEAVTPQGHIGIKCWIFKGKYGEKLKAREPGDDRMRRPTGRPTR
ncbi:MAG: 30S ribosomal protein S3 [Planctomycetes bacterium]|nr:30S ribosomal protein S3 [Planctomycetota bacterium]